jgi:MscS family membrane protein
MYWGLRIPDLVVAVVGGRPVERGPVLVLLERYNQQVATFSRSMRVNKPPQNPGLFAEPAVAGQWGGSMVEESVFLGLSVDDWINLGILLVVVLLATTLVARLLAFALKRLVRRTSNRFDDLYIASTLPYLRWMLGLVVLYIGTGRLGFLTPELHHALSHVYFALIVVIVVVLLWKLVDGFGLWYREKTQPQGGALEKEAVVLLAERAARGLLVLVALMIMLDRLGVSILALVTALGVGGLAVSLAAQDTIANVISGIILLIDAPFRVGDRIEIQGLDTWGDVMKIGLRTTRIRTLDNRSVIVPNSSISNNQVVNYTFPDSHYRTQTEINVAYGSDLRRVRRVITESLQGTEGVVQDKPVDVLFLEFGESAMNLRVRWWIESYQDARRIMDRVNEAIYKALEQADIEMPNPIMTVDLVQRNPKADQDRA